MIVNQLLLSNLLFLVVFVRAEKALLNINGPGSTPMIVDQEYTPVDFRWVHDKQQLSLIGNSSLCRRDAKTWWQFTNDRMMQTGACLSVWALASNFCWDKDGDGYGSTSCVLSLLAGIFMTAATLSYAAHDVTMIRAAADHSKRDVATEFASSAFYDDGKFRLEWPQNTPEHLRIRSVMPSSLDVYVNDTQLMTLDIDGVYESAIITPRLPPNLSDTLAKRMENEGDARDLLYTFKFSYCHPHGNHLTSKYDWDDMCANVFAHSPTLCLDLTNEVAIVDLNDYTGSQGKHVLIMEGKLVLETIDGAGDNFEG